MRAERILRVECLDTVDARNLFKKTLGEWYLTSNAGVHRLIEQVADECAGLPLALVVIARAMSTKTTIQEWQAAVVSLKRSLENKLLGEDNYMFSTLKFSYDSLQNDDLRMCFLYCSLWPEDHAIWKKDIIAICIGSGIIKDFENVSEAYDMGHCLIEELKGACLLEVGSDDQDEVKMHDVIRDLALWIASECGENKKKWLVKSGIGLQEVQLEVEKWKEAHVVSLMHNDKKEFPCVPFECLNLSILMLQGNMSLGKILPSIFQNMPALTVLSLENTRMEELPESIGMLTMLRHLNLSKTRLRSLPKGLGNLTRLRYLHVSYVDSLVSIPAGVISSLVELQVLDLSLTIVHVAAEQFNETSDKIPSLIDEVEYLPGGLKGFGVDLVSADDFRHLSMLSRVFTWYLRLVEMQNLDIVQLKRNMWSSLHWMWLVRVNDVKVLEFAEGKINDTCPIEELAIEEAWELEEIIFRGVVPSVFFQRLQFVQIVRCYRLKNISWILGLQSLVELELYNCKGMELLISEVPGGGGERGRTITFDSPPLRDLKLLHLQDLRSICCGPITRIGFPALEELTVKGCPNLKKFPFLPPNINNNKLKEITCDKQWWQGLEVEESIKNSLKGVAWMRLTRFL